MSEITNPNWQGAAKLVNMRKALTWGGWFVTEYRLRNMSKWLGAIFAFGLGQPVLFLLSIGVGIGALVDKGSHGHPMDGVGYLVFLAPALLATAAIQGAMDEVTFPTLQGFVWDKSFFSMNATQLSGRMIVQGIMMASAIRCLMTVFMYEAILLAFGAIQWSALPALTWSASIAGISFASVMLGVTSFVKQDDGFFAIVGRFILAPMFMFSGTYYPLEFLPTPLQAIGWISPVWHSTNLGRIMSYGHAAPEWLVPVHYAFLAVLFIVGQVVATKKFEQRLSA
jgi:lipooligosaccharide transport system permease protein